MNAYEEVEIGEEGEDMEGAGAEGYGGGGEGTDGGDVELGHDGCQQSVGKLIQARLFHIRRHF